MEIYQIKNLTFTYPGREVPALYDLCLTIESGSFVTIVGPSGSGKTTLLRSLKPSIAPHGEVRGQIFFGGSLINTFDARAESSKIGFVAQNPENQIVTDKVWHELAFGLESLGYSTPTIRLRVAEIASFFGIQSWFDKSVTELSGGQKQLLSLASIMAMQPSVLLLDEPTSQLDPIAASEFLSTISKINRELGITVVMSEHRLDEVFSLTDRVIVMDAGRIIADGPPAKIGMDLRNKGNHIFYALPVPMRVYAAVDGKGLYPLTVREGRDWLTTLNIKNKDWKFPEPDRQKSKKPTIELDEVWFRYDKDQPDVLKGLSFKAYEGEITTVLGGNGTGKTTMLSLISALHKPYRGKVLINGKSPEKISDLFNGILGVLPQNPHTLFVGKTVQEDLWEMLAELKISKNEKFERLKEVVSICRLGELLQFHPYDLSGGEQQRAALAKVLLLKPLILLLDEPTKGLDAEYKFEFAQILRSLANSGVTVLIVSHDIEFCAEYADRCALFFDGNIISVGNPREFFAGNSFYTPMANRMARHVLPEAITARDIVTALGGDTSLLVPPRLDNMDDLASTDSTLDAEKTEGNEPVLPRERKSGVGELPKRTVAAVIMILLAIPLTIYAGIFFFNDRKYYLISMLILLEAMLPFVLVFESRKPQARELLIIAVLCTIGVAGRTAFFMLPQFKPVVAIVIISGVALGGEAGFLVGAVTGFVSNMFFGQGPWTPWQMFALGIIGFLAGMLFRKGVLGKSRSALCVYGGLATVIIYGTIMNISTIFTYQENPTIQMFWLAILQGIPFDLVHGAATVTFLFILAYPMLEKLDRVKQKYGLIER